MESIFKAVAPDDFPESTEVPRVIALVEVLCGHNRSHPTTASLVRIIASNILFVWLRI